MAPNGYIYDGRQGDSLGDDNVIGAHMCARNTNTMGICLLGNYQLSGIYPSDTALGSINELVTWKLWKEQLLNPYDSSLHPVANPVMYLGVIAGHRQGCSAGYTECPGQNYFDIIEPRIKAVTAIRLANCIANGIATEKPLEILVFPNPLGDAALSIVSQEPIQEIKILNTLGEVIYERELNYPLFDLKIEKDKFEDVGTIFIMIKTSNGNYYQKIINQ